jgi:hypothetical protein
MYFPNYLLRRARKKAPCPQAKVIDDADDRKIDAMRRPFA